MSHYVNHLEDYQKDSTNQENDNQEELEKIPTSSLPDLIQSQKVLSDSLEKEIFREMKHDLNEEPNDAILESKKTLVEESTDKINEIIPSFANTLEEINLPD